MFIQIILTGIIVLIVINSLIKLRKKEITGKQFIGWLAIWLLAALIIIWPAATVYIANLVGIGRGSDLVVYLSVIALFYIIFRLILRIEKLEKNLTKLVREEALKDYDNKQ